MHHVHSTMRLYSKRSERLYLNRAERKQFENIALNKELQTQLLCLLLLYTGCRLSEALAVKGADFQWSEGIVSIKSLKKRDKHHVREISIPTHVFAPALQQIESATRDQTLIEYCRTTAWRSIKQVMSEANIIGSHATPKGLRHSFGVHCAFNNIPMPLCQKWLGHADIRTTAIYYQIIGREEREMAERLWQ